MDFSYYHWSSKAIYAMGRFLSCFADLIIANSYAATPEYALCTSSAKKLKVIPNGIDVERFKPRPTLREQMRKEWQVKDEDVVVGLIGRLDPVKDHPSFFHAAHLVLKELKNIRFVCVGDGPPEYREKLHILSSRLGLQPHLIWIHNAEDMVSIYNGLDIATLPSAYGEGFPNAVAEAMACGIPCVVTNVGDLAKIVSDTGIMVPPTNPELLAQAFLKLAAQRRSEIGKQARMRIVQNFNLDNLIQSTITELERLLQHGHHNTRIPGAEKWDKT